MKLLAQLERSHYSISEAKKKTNHFSIEQSSPKMKLSIEFFMTILCLQLPTNMSWTIENIEN